MTRAEPPPTLQELSSAELLRRKPVWAVPMAMASVLVMLMTLVYFGSIVDPTAHLHGLPVAVVNEDRGAVTGPGRTDLGAEVVDGLTHTPAVTDRLALDVVSLAGAEAQMDKGAAYAAVVVPPGYTASTLDLVQDRPLTGGEPPAIELMTNSRAGSLGVSLAEGVLQPAISKITDRINGRLQADAPAGSLGRALLAGPAELEPTAYRPLPAHSGLGLSAFYVALLIMMCGFLGATIINTSVDSVLGYTTTEVGPWWKQKLPRPISRWQTLLTKWAIAVPGTLVFTGALIGIAAGALRMDAPNWFELWMFAWFAAAVIAIGTLVLFAALGALGQLIALLVFVYLALASSGGTVPLQALAGFYRFVANFEPLRQIVGAVRAILYFKGAGDAGLDRGLLLSAIGLVFWVAAGTLVTKWYDIRGFYRMEPGLMEYVHASARARPSPGAAAVAPPTGAVAVAPPTGAVAVARSTGAGAVEAQTATGLRSRSKRPPLWYK